MTKKIIDTHKCKGCRICVSVCPKKNIEMSDDRNKFGFLYPKFIDTNNCHEKCNYCMVMCPDVAIKIKKIKE